MISFDRQGVHFKYRVAGLCIHNGHVLLTSADGDEYWILPGGRVELGEDSRTALEREIAEETGDSTRVGDLLWVTENFFDLDGTDYHELAFTYAILPDEPAILDNAWTRRTVDGNSNIELRWFALDHLEDVPFEPAFLRPLLKDPGETPRHLIVRQPKKEADR